jgi:hypothetical protein
MNRHIAVLLSAAFLQACATPLLDAPPAPCASIERDCGPAKAVNWSLASSSPVVRSAQHG